MELTGKIKVTGGGRRQRRAPRRRPPRQPMAAAPGHAGADPPRRSRSRPRCRPRRSAGASSGTTCPSLITAFFQTRETGELGVQRGKVKKVVYFESGMPVFALSNLLSDRFGQFLVRVGKIRPEQLADVALMAQQTKRRTGDVLVERGLLRDTERLYYVGQQVKSIIYSLFAWEEGTYVMSFEEKARGESLKLDVHPANLIVRGVKKLYKAERLKRILALEDRLIPSRQPAYPLNEIELERWEAELLPHVDGTRTVAELIAHARRPEPVVQLTLTSLRRGPGAGEGRGLAEDLRQQRPAPEHSHRHAERPRGGAGPGPGARGLQQVRERPAGQSQSSAIPSTEPPPNTSGVGDPFGVGIEPGEHQRGQGAAPGEPVDDPDQQRAQREGAVSEVDVRRLALRGREAARGARGDGETPCSISARARTRARNPRKRSITETPSSNAAVSRADSVVRKSASAPPIASSATVCPSPQ